MKPAYLHYSTIELKSHISYTYAAKQQKASPSKLSSIVHNLPNVVQDSMAAICVIAMPCCLIASLAELRLSTAAWRWFRVFGIVLNASGYLNMKSKRPIAALSPVPAISTMTRDIVPELDSLDRRASPRHGIHTNLFPSLPLRYKICILTVLSDLA